jgi:hypothetical protein
VIGGDIFARDISFDIDDDARSSFLAAPQYDEDGKLIAPSVVLLWDMLKVSVSNLLFIFNNVFFAGQI